MLLFRSKVPYYWIAVGLAFLTFCATYFLVHSKTGFYWRAINGDEAAARSWAWPPTATRCWPSCCRPA